MKNTSRFLAVAIILFFAGVQQAEQGKDSESSKRDRLLADENIRLTNELAKCRSEIEKQKKQIEQFQQNGKKLKRDAIIDANYTRNLQNAHMKLQSDYAKQQKQLEQYREMIDKKDAPAICRAKVDSLKKQLEQCRQEKEQAELMAGKNTTEIFDKIPPNLQDDIDRLTNENDALKQKIAELEKKQKDTNKAGKQQ